MYCISIFIELYCVPQSEQCLCFHSLGCYFHSHHAVAPKSAGAVALPLTSLRECEWVEKLMLEYYLCYSCKIHIWRNIDVLRLVSCFLFSLCLMSWIIWQHWSWVEKQYLKLLINWINFVAKRFSFCNARDDNKASMMLFTNCKWFMKE